MSLATNYYLSYLNTMAAMAPVAHSLHVGPVHWPRKTMNQVYLRPPEMVFTLPNPRGRFVYRRNELIQQLAGLRGFQESLANDAQQFSGTRGELAQQETARFDELIRSAYDAAVSLYEVETAKEQQQERIQATETAARATFAPLTNFTDLHTGLALLALTTDDPIALYFDRDASLLNSALMMG